MLKKSFKKIILWLENQDSIELLNQDIDMLLISKVKDNYIKSKNELIKFLECKDFVIILNSSILKNHYINNIDNESEDTIEDRLKKQDILCIEFIYDDDTKENINIPWDDNNDYINSYQSYVYSDNNLVVRCNKKKTAKKFMKKKE